MAREIDKTRPHYCGYCIVGDHHLCKSEIKWYDFTWICQCHHKVDDE